MSLSSMTGFGEASATEGDWTLRVTLRSVNHRQLDVRAALPGELSATEPKLLELVKSRLRRGRVDMKVSATRAELGAEEELAAAAERLRSVAESFDLPPITISDLLRFSQFGGARSESTVGTAAIIHCAEEALDALCEFRSREGRALQEFFEGHLESLSVLLTSIEGAAAGDIERHRTRLGARVAELLGDGHVLDAARLEQEVVLIAERSDITEEIARATEHVRALRSLVEDHLSIAKGKRLDFLLQELIRETNTMASKSVSATITHLVVEAKTAIEQLREQALNVE